MQRFRDGQTEVAASQLMRIDSGWLVSTTSLLALHAESIAIIARTAETPRIALGVLFDFKPGLLEVDLIIVPDDSSATFPATGDSACAVRRRDSHHLGVTLTRLVGM